MEYELNRILGLENMDITHWKNIQCNHVYIAIYETLC